MEDRKILVTRSSMPELSEYMDEIEGLWDSRWLTNMGAKHKALQQKLKDYLGVENVELLTNGHMALELTLQAMNLQGEVITTPFTFASTTHAIVRNGLKPVFCDINPVTYTMDVEKIEALITDRTCAIMPVHVYGNVCDVDEIQRIAHKYELKVIYDAAHAFGEALNGDLQGGRNRQLWGCVLLQLPCYEGVQQHRRRGGLLPRPASGQCLIRTEKFRHPRARGGQRCRG